MKATRKETTKWHSFSWSSQTFHHFYFPLSNLHKLALYISLPHLASSFPIKFLRQGRLPLDSSLIRFIAGRETNFGFSEISTAEASVFKIHCPELTFTLVLWSWNSQWKLAYTRHCRTYCPHHLGVSPQRESVSWKLVWKETLIFPNGQSRLNSCMEREPIPQKPGWVTSAFCCACAQKLFYLCK